MRANSGDEPTLVAEVGEVGVDEIGLEIVQIVPSLGGVEGGGVRLLQVLLQLHPGLDLRAPGSGEVREEDCEAFAVCHCDGTLAFIVVV